MEIERKEGTHRHLAWQVSNAVVEGRSERQWIAFFRNSRQSKIAFPEVAIGQVSWVRNSEGSLRNICILKLEFSRQRLKT